MNGHLHVRPRLYAKSPHKRSGARFSKGPETFRAHKAIFSSSVFKNGEVQTPETSCMKKTSVHIKSMRIKQLCNHKVRDFAMAFRVRTLLGTFEKRAPGSIVSIHGC